MFIWDFKNEKTNTHGIHYSRYIASWLKEGGKINNLFKRWLREEMKLTDEEIKDIVDMAENGKLEFEMSAYEFLEKQNI